MDFSIGARINGEQPPQRMIRSRLRSPLSGLTGQILALNVLALALLVGGILYFNQFRSSLVDTRLTALINEAEMLAGAVSEVASEGPGAVTVNAGLAEPVLLRLTSGKSNRARLFAPDGSLMIDSSRIVPAAQVLEQELAPPGAQRGIGPRWNSFKTWFVRLISSEPNYPPYTERFDQTAADYPELAEAYAGDIATAVRTTEAKTLMLTVAVPVQRFHRVLGALLVSVETTEIDEMVRQERLAILEVFGIALLMTAFLSLILAGTIARPVRHLADFAHQVRQGRGRQIKMPDFTRRRDELGDLSRALRDMTRALYRRIDAIEAFAADVAHEFKNPLTSLRSAVETIKVAQNDAQREKLLAIIRDDIARLDRLISDISNASRLDAELLRSEMSVIDVPQMLETIVEVYANSDDLSQPDIVTEIAAGRLQVTGIEGHLGQVIRNLVDNAISFSPEGATIKISAVAKDAKLNIYVEDEGPGIPEDRLETIFERFYSERPDSEAFGIHSGLGLNICKQIVTVHGGEIWAENRYDLEGSARIKIGARFVISLPLTPSEPKA